MDISTQAGKQPPVDKEPLYLHCRKCIQDTIETGTKHSALYECILFESDLFIVCPTHREPVTIVKVDNAPEICSACAVAP